MRIWRMQWYSVKESMQHFFWFETRQAATHALEKHDGPAKDVQLESLKVPTDTRRDFVRWLNANFPAR